MTTLCFWVDLIIQKGSLKLVLKAVLERVDLKISFVISKHAMDQCHLFYPEKVGNASVTTLLQL